MSLSNNFKDIYGIVLNDKIDSQNQNLKDTSSLKSDVRGVDFDKNDFDFFFFTKH